MSIPAQFGALLTGPEVERPTTIPAVVVELQQALGGKVAVDTAARTARSHDRSHLPPVLPDAVVRPSSTEDVATAVRICAAHGVAVLPIGAGTGLEEGANARAGVVTIDLSGMTGIPRLADAGAVAAWAEEELLHANVSAVVAEREFLAGELRRRGLEVPENGGNFLWIAMELARELEQACVRHGVSVRAFDGEGVGVTICGRGASRAVLAAVDSYLRR